MYDYVIFDCDDVLVKNIEPWLSAFDKITAEYGLNLDREQKRVAFTDFAWMTKFGLPEDQVTIFITKVKSLALPALTNAPLYEGALDLLDSLKQNGVKLGVVSNSSVDVRLYLERNAITKYFDPYIISGKDVQNRKPHPEGIERLLSLMKAVKSNAVMVGNSATDLEAANAAGIDSILFNPKENSILNDIEELMAQKPKYTVSTHAELAEILL
jgi:HAD superfamily hydrolase (TIGR01509 family)